MYRVQIWQDQVLLHEFEQLSLDAAREIAKTHRNAFKQTARIMADDRDWCEVYACNGSYRQGTFAQTTLVRFTE